MSAVTDGESMEVKRSESCDIAHIAYGATGIQVCPLFFNLLLLQVNG